MSMTLAALLSLVATTVQPSPTPVPAIQPISLPPPHTSGGRPLMEALAHRATSRSFSSTALPPQTLADLLWAAWGVNRPEEGKRTAPSARNAQEIDVYVVMASGAYLYDAVANTLAPVVPGDHRALTGTQELVKEAPVTLVFVADLRRAKGGPGEEQVRWAWADAAFISENVYLFAASAGLATGVRAMIDRPALARALALRDDQIITMAQCVGLPKP